MVAHRTNPHIGFFLNLSAHRFFKAFARFHKASER